MRAFVSSPPALLALLGLLVPWASPAPPLRGGDGGAPVVAARIDRDLERHWETRNVRPAGSCDDLEFLRRLTLDLCGRVPTAAEARAFARDTSSEKRQRAIRSLMEGPEFALHFGFVLDRLIQGKYAGERDFIEFLRTSLRERKPWDRVFREILVGPWDSDEKKRSQHFLGQRVRSLDEMTNDTARVFFGVNISCARCHDHPLVEDWKQDHYYGLVSFFHRTYQKKKGKERVLAEKDRGDVTFQTTAGEKRTAKLMFLSGRVLEPGEPIAGAGDSGAGENLTGGVEKDGTGEESRASPPTSRREILVEVALQEESFFSRAIVNHLWAYFFGRGLVHPPDQMHSRNPPAVPDLLEWLAHDLAANGYRLERLVEGIVSSRVYQLRSGWEGEGKRPDDTDFAFARLRPLSPRQYAMSILLATGNAALEVGKLESSHRELESRAPVLTGSMDPREDYQSSATEALFMSNNAEVQKLLQPSGANLVARLLELTDRREQVETAFWALLGRAPSEEELGYLVEWIEERRESGEEAWGQLVWSIFTSAEFRFIH